MECGSSGVDNFQLAGSAIGKELSASLKQAKVRKAECRPDGDQIACKVLIVIEKKGVRLDCERTMSELAR